MMRRKPQVDWGWESSTKAETAPQPEPFFTKGVLIPVADTYRRSKKYPWVLETEKVVAKFRDWPSVHHAATTIQGTKTLHFVGTKSVQLTNDLELPDDTTVLNTSKKIPAFTVAKFHVVSLKLGNNTSLVGPGLLFEASDGYLFMQSPA
jgi:hypothetical protein